MNRPPDRIASAMRLLLCCWLLVLGGVALAASGNPKDAARAYHDARWNPLHFAPAIDHASDAQCLQCHGEIEQRRPRDRSPAGVPADETLAWYQTLDTYRGPQDSFHRRHRDTPLAKRLMRLRCNSCHRGHNPDREVAVDGDPLRHDPALRKDVDSDICLMCHGRFDYTVMPGLSAPWSESRERFQNNCLACHRAFRTQRHQLNFLNAKAIEEAGEADGDVCYGCHGGRAWYALAYPYVRRPWPRMPSVTPSWAAGRPSQYPARFLNNEADNNE